MRLSSDGFDMVKMLTHWFMLVSPVPISASSMLLITSCVVVFGIAFAPPCVVDAGGGLVMLGGGVGSVVVVVVSVVRKMSEMKRRRCGEEWLFSMTITYKGSKTRERIREGCVCVCVLLAGLVSWFFWKRLEERSERG